MKRTNIQFLTIALLLSMTTAMHAPVFEATHTSKGSAINGGHPMQEISSERLSNFKNYIESQTSPEKKIQAIAETYKYNNILLPDHADILNQAHSEGFIDKQGNLTLDTNPNVSAPETLNTKPTNQAKINMDQIDKKNVEANDTSNPATSDELATLGIFGTPLAQELPITESASTQGQTQQENTTPENGLNKLFTNKKPYQGENLQSTRENQLALIPGEGVRDVGSNANGDNIVAANRQSVLAARRLRDQTINLPSQFEESASRSMPPLDQQLTPAPKLIGPKVNADNTITITKENAGNILNNIETTPTPPSAQAPTESSAPTEPAIPAKAQQSEPLTPADEAQANAASLRRSYSQALSNKINNAASKIGSAIGLTDGTIKRTVTDSTTGARKVLTTDKNKQLLSQKEDLKGIKQTTKYQPDGKIAQQETVTANTNYLTNNKKIVSVTFKDGKPVSGDVLNNKNVTIGKIEYQADGKSYTITDLQERTIETYSAGDETSPSIRIVTNKDGSVTATYENDPKNPDVTKTEKTDAKGKYKVTTITNNKTGAKTVHDPRTNTITATTKSGQSIIYQVDGSYTIYGKNTIISADADGKLTVTPRSYSSAISRSASALKEAVLGKKLKLNDDGTIYSDPKLKLNGDGTISSSQSSTSINADGDLVITQPQNAPDYSSTVPEPFIYTVSAKNGSIKTTQEIKLTDQYKKDNPTIKARVQESYENGPIFDTVTDVSGYTKSTLKNKDGSNNVIITNPIGNKSIGSITISRENRTGFMARNLADKELQLTFNDIAPELAKTAPTPENYNAAIDKIAARLTNGGWVTSKTIDINNLKNSPEYIAFKEDAISTLMDKVQDQKLLGSKTLAAIGEFPKRLISRLVTIDSKAIRQTRNLAVTKTKNSAQPVNPTWTTAKEESYI